jgi:hypothetical protein
LVFLLVLLPLLLPSLVLAQFGGVAARVPPVGRFVPVDEGNDVPEFQEFRQKLLTIIEKKDEKALLEHLDDHIKCSFGGDTGKVDFIQMWNLDTEPKNSPLWRALKSVLTLGGTWQKGEELTFFAPCYFNREVPGNPDAFELFFTIGEQVRVREKPDVASPIRDELNWEVVFLVADSAESEVTQTLNGEAHPWKKVITPRGKTGYVFGKYLRSPIDYRAAFSRRTGTWKMDFFLSGD